MSGEQARAIDQARREVSRREVFVQRAKDEAEAARAKLMQALATYTNAESVVALHCEQLDRARDALLKLERVEP